MADKIALDLRGERFSIDRDNLMALPESILLCLFPNGVVLNPTRQQTGGLGTEGITGQTEEEDVYFVDVSLLSLPFDLTTRSSEWGH